MLNSLDLRLGAPCVGLELVEVGAGAVSEGCADGSRQGDRRLARDSINRVSYLEVVVDNESGPLSENEWQRFFAMLQRICAYDLDQWANWQIDTPYGPVYVTLNRELPPDASAEAFWKSPIPPTPA